MPHRAAVLFRPAAMQANDPQGSRLWQKNCQGHLKTIANINDSGTCLVLSPAATIAVVSGANSPAIAKSLKKEMEDQAQDSL